MLETLLPRLLLNPQPGLDPREYFASSPGQEGKISGVWLEIGFGAGEHLAWQGGAHPDVGIIGVEPYVAGMAKLLAKLDPLSPSGGEGQGEGDAVAHRWRGGNIRLYTEDARDIIAALPDASLGRVFILFPDPWPKTRHHKRRFIQMEMLDALARVMGKGAELRFATDDSGYLVWALERFLAHPQFRWMANCARDWRTRPPDWPETRYEAKALRSGRACAYLRFLRV